MLPIKRRDLHPDKCLNFLTFFLKKNPIINCRTSGYSERLSETISSSIGNILFSVQKPQNMLIFFLGKTILFLALLINQCEIPGERNQADSTFFKQIYLRSPFHNLANRSNSSNPGKRTPLTMELDRYFAKNYVLNRLILHWLGWLYSGSMKNDYMF